MKKATENIVENLIKLRKKFGYSQVELSQKINYSDKAISRWEKGEVVPSIDVLEQLAEIYGVKISYFFEEHLDDIDVKIKEKTFNLHLYIMFSLVLVVWTVAVLTFFTLKNYYGEYFFQVLVWALPLTMFVIAWCCTYYFNGKFYLLTSSLCSWLTLVGIYFQFLHLNLWPIFFFGIPVQILLILISLLAKINGQKKKNSDTAKKVENFFTRKQNKQ